MKTLEEYLFNHSNLKLVDEKRLGQRFCNDYYIGDWPVLFYEADDIKAETLITSYLKDLQYYPYLPIRKDI